MQTRSPKNNKGVALVVVLAFLVLLSVFIVSFFSSSQNELSAAQSFSGGVTAQQLAESVVSVVQNQIREATTRNMGAWASQPGMIRVYRDRNGPSSKAEAFFKLYSSDDMIVSGSELTSFATGQGEGVKPKPTDIDSKWRSMPAYYTDINEPVVVDMPTATTKKAAKFPIVDGNALKELTIDGNKVYTYDSDGDKVPDIEGFSIDPSDVDFKASAEISAANTPVSMPVKWIYMLRDGTLTAPTASKGGDGTQAKWAGGSTAAPSLENPIVGRVSFWTDDESCKVNINTAGGFSELDINPKKGGTKLYTNVANLDAYPGSFWDTPRLYTMFDRGFQKSRNDPTLTSPGLAASQPVRGEFQRYPGHPSTTSLGLVFQNFLTSEQVYSLAPRLRRGATRGGTDRLLAAYDDPIDIRSRRLYSSIDELFYAQSATPLAEGVLRETTDKMLQTKITNKTDPDYDNSYVPLSAASEAITPEMLERLRFFLTANSRSPELNLFGRPRVSMWPLWDEVKVKTQPTTEPYSYWNASDKLLAFCSTIGPSDPKRPAASGKPTYRFNFQRRNAYSTTEDFNLPVNQALMNYLKDVTSQPIPGYNDGRGLSFVEKFRAAEPTPPGVSKGKRETRDQVLMEIFDYIRTVNLRDSTNDKLIGTAKVYTNEGPDFSRKHTQYVMDTASKVKLSEKYKYAPRGIVVPTKVSTSLGFGRFPTISEVALVLYHAGYEDSAGAIHLNLDKITSDTAVANNPQNKRKLIVADYVKAFLIFETFNPMQGYGPTTTPNSNSDQKKCIIIEVTKGMSGFKVNGTPLGFPDSGRNPYNSSSASGWHGRNSGGSEGFVHTLLGNNPTTPNWKPEERVPNKWRTSPGVDGTKGEMWYEFQSAPGNGVRVPRVTNGQFRQFPKDVLLNGATLEIKVRFGFANVFGNGGNPDDVQSMVLQFPAQATVPMPTDLIWADVPKMAEATGDVTEIINTTKVGQDMLGDLVDAGGFGSNSARLTSLNVIPELASCLQPGIADPVNGPGYLFAGVKSFATRLRGTATQGTTWGGIISGKQDHNSNDHSRNTKPGYDNRNRWRQILQPGDTVRSMLLVVNDVRTAALGAATGVNSVYQAHPDYNRGLAYDSKDGYERYRQTQTLRTGNHQLYYPQFRFPRKGFPQLYTYQLPPGDEALAPQAIIVDGTKFSRIAANTTDDYPKANAPDLAADYDGTNSLYRQGVRRLKDNQPGDFDTGIGTLGDGAFAGKADEGNLAFEKRESYLAKDDTRVYYWWYPIPYFDYPYEEAFDTFFSPNRQVPSAGVFGSLLAGRYAEWQTLCFSPNPAGNTVANPHPGRDSRFGPKDYLLLDLFTMPVVEPYAISEPFSTAGKVNMNYPIMPFSYIKRSTAMRAALHSSRVTAVPKTEVKYYKSRKDPSAAVETDLKNKGNYRYLIDRDSTLKSFEENSDDDRTSFSKYSKSPDLGMFKSAAEICDFFLYPKVNGKSPANVSWDKADSSIRRWWSDQTVTGDNLREKPYTDLYPRLTTKSNVFTVHMRVQSLRQTAASAAKQMWDEKKDRVIGEYRGSSTIERYIDPEDPRFAKKSDTNKYPIVLDGDLNLSTVGESLEPAYRFRVVNTKRFNP